MTKELDDLMNSKIDGRTKKLRSVYPGFKSISEKLKDAKISPDFWIKEQQNIIAAVKEGRKEKESMKMSFEKYHQEFTI